MNVLVPDLCLFRWKGNGEVATRRNWKAVLKSLPGERPSPSRLFDRQQNMAKRRSLRWPEYILNAELLLDLTRPHDSNLEKNANAVQARNSIPRRTSHKDQK